MAMTSAMSIPSSDYPGRNAYDLERPQLYARLAGAIYLAVILFGGFSEGVVMNAVVVPGDSHATVARIVADPGLWNIGLATNLIVPLIAVVQLWIEYMLLRPAGRKLALLFVMMNLASLSVEAVSKLFQLMVLPLATSGTADGTYSLAVLAVLGHGVAFNIALIFFGASCLLIGVLIWRSGYLPRFIGVLMFVAGLCYLTASFAELLAPAFAGLINPGILVPVLIGESALCLWLLVMGVNVPKWREKVAD